MTAHSEGNESVKSAMQQMMEEIKGLTSQIAEESSKVQEQIEGEKEAMYSETVGFHEQMRALEEDLIAVRQKCYDDEMELMRAFREKRRALGPDNRDDLAIDVKTLQDEMDMDDEDYQSKLEEHEIRLEALKYLEPNSLSLRVQTHHPDNLTIKINRLTREKNAAKNKFETAGARDEERLEIDRLEGILAQRSAILSQLTRELTRIKQPEPEATQEPVETGGSKLPKLTA